MGIRKRAHISGLLAVLAWVAPLFAVAPDVDVSACSYDCLLRFAQKAIDQEKQGLGMLLPMIIATQLETKIDNSALNGLDHHRPLAYRAICSGNGTLMGAWHLPVSDAGLFRSGFVPGSALKTAFRMVPQADSVVLVPREASPADEKELLACNCAAPKSTHPQLLQAELRGDFVARHVVPWVDAWSRLDGLAPAARWLKLMARETDCVRMGLRLDTAKVYFKVSLVPKAQSELARLCAMPAVPTLQNPQGGEPFYFHMSPRACPILLDMMMGLLHMHLRPASDKADLPAWDKAMARARAQLGNGELRIAGSAEPQWRGSISYLAPRLDPATTQACIEDLVKLLQVDVGSQARFQTLELKARTTSVGKPVLQNLHCETGEPAGTREKFDLFYHLTTGRLLAALPEAGELEPLLAQPTKVGTALAEDALLSLSLNHFFGLAARQFKLDASTWPTFAPDDILLVRLQMGGELSAELEIPERTLAKFMLTALKLTMVLKK